MATPLQHVTSGQLKDELTATELEAIPMAVFGSADTPEAVIEAWFAERVLQAADRVVAAVNSCSRNTSIAAGLCKVPSACVRTVLVLARHAVISAIPGLAETLEGSTRAAEYSTAIRDLQALATCELVPEYTLEDGEESEKSGGTTCLFGEQKSDFLF